MRLLVCGSRDWDDPEIVATVLDGFYNRTVFMALIEGGASGADACAALWADTHTAPFDDVLHESYPADWDTHGRAAGPIRNQKMLDTGIDLVLAFTDDLRTSRGTKDMVTRARKAGVKTYVIGR